jgi:Glycosyl transferase family 8
MTQRRAVAYTATPGYLFQTLLSAVQARRNVAEDTDVHLLALVQRGEAERELEVMASVATAHGITFHRVPREILSGLHPTFARLFLDEALPEGIGKVLYLDGDTQVRGSLAPLLDRPLDRGRLAAVRDPMTVIRPSHRRLRRRIDRAWDAADLSAGMRSRYVNAGVLVFHLADLAGFRERVLSQYAERGSSFPYRDQDAINSTLSDLIDHLEVEWNYPGFLLGVDWAARDNARIVHFMSDPRPWDGSYLPWRRDGHRPYEDLVRQHPELSPYWRRPRGARALRNHAQQIYKAFTEGRHWRSAPFRACLQLVYPDRLTTSAPRSGPVVAEPVSSS